jgi:hypothetical protein
VDQDGFSIAIGVAALALLASGLWRGRFDIEFVRTARAAQPLRYWAVALVLALVAIEAWRQAIFVGCREC